MLSDNVGNGILETRLRAVPDQTRLDALCVFRGCFKLQALVYDILPFSGGTCRKAMLGVWGVLLCFPFFNVAVSCFSVLALI